MAKCCNDNLSKIFCDTYNKYYNTLYTNGEISKKETENLLVISYIRKLFINPRYINYRPILIKALRCIADKSCLLDSSELYGRLDIKTVGDKFVTVQMRDIYSVKIEETDPTVPLYVKDIKQSDIANWDNKLSLETDPVFSASPAATITEEDIDNWNNPSIGGALAVTLTLDGTFSADYTYTEILEAWNNKQDVILIYANSEYQFSYTDNVEGGSIYFFRADSYGGPFLDYFELDGTDDSWHQHIISLQTKLTFDNIPTLNSNNPVKSSGIYNMCPIIEDTRSSAVATITGVAPFASLENGQRIVLHLAFPNLSNPTLQLTLSNGTLTSAYNIYGQIRTNVMKLTQGYYRAETYLPMIFASNRWNVIADANTLYDSITQALLNVGADVSNRLISPKLIHDNAYIVEETYSSGSLKANKMYNFGTVSSLTVPSLDATNDLVSNALNFYALRFIAGADDLNITFPTGVIVDDEPTINTGDYVEIMINKYGSNFYASIKVWQAQ